MPWQHKGEQSDYALISERKEVDIYSVVGRHPDTDFMALVDAIDVQLLIYSYGYQYRCQGRESRMTRLTWKMVCAKALVANAAKVRREAKDRMV